jgi:hypothetical protein
MAVLLLCTVLSDANAQDAIVTFYSHGSYLTSGIPGTAHDIYIGSIFDGSQGVFSFRGKFIAHNNRFITLRFAPGPYTFGASNGKRPEPRESLSINLEANEHYFIRAQGESQGVPGVFTIQHGRLDLMTCSEAQIDIAKAKPLNGSALWKEARPKYVPLVVDESSARSCH